jgi:formylglycine-generating enzyme required for sulfatase activity
MSRMLVVALILWTGAACASPQITVDLPGGATMAFVWIEPGTFRMGSPASESGRTDTEGPQHQVTLTKGFWLGQYEITQGQWQAVMGTAPWSGQVWAQAGAGYPAVCVSWDDLQAYIHVLNQAVGDSLYRLPTEAEWEYACRAGTTTPWSCGDDESALADYAWYMANTWNAGLTWAQAVGSRQANPWGLCDMHGNVWEWVQDRFRYYSYAPQIDPLGGLMRIPYRVMRSGSYGDPAGGTRSAARFATEPNTRAEYVGGRLLRIEKTPTVVAPGSWGQVKRAP